MTATSYTIKYGDNLNAIAAANGTSVDELVKANAIADPNKIKAGASLSIPSKVAAPVATPATPTVPAGSYPIYAGGSSTPAGPGDTPVSYRDKYGKDTPATPSASPTKTIAQAASAVPDYSFQNDEDPAIADYLSRIKTDASSTIDEATLRQQARDRIQTQVDSIKLAGAQALARARLQGQDRLGQARSGQARSGTLGSTFSDSQNNQLLDYNTGIETDTQAETDSKVSALLNQADKDATQEIKDRRDAREKGATAYLEFITKRDTDRTSKASALAKMFAANGVDPSTLSTQDQAKLKTSYGLDVKTFGGLVADAKAAKAKADAENKKTELASQPDSVREYNFAKDNGYTGTYNDYQNLDANRKVAIAKAGQSGNGFTPYQTFQATQSLKKTVQSNTQASTIIKQQGQTLNSTWARYKSGGAKDLNGTSQAIITTFNKLLDPTSVVRETEYDRSGQGQALLQSIQGKISSIANGGPGLTEASLQELVDLGNVYTRNAQAAIDAQNEQASEEAKFFGINPEFVVRTNSTGADETVAPTSVKVKSPAGVVGTIPIEKLKAAQAAGYTQVQ